LHENNIHRNNRQRFYCIMQPPTQFSRWSRKCNMCGVNISEVNLVLPAVQFICQKDNMGPMQCSAPHLSFICKAVEDRHTHWGGWILNEKMITLRLMSYDN
jgi:hypothetical protein